jgi:crotonobetainyl-CoA:carnitine CoA-transferase CaiB-like acyl-CoA transferase
VPGDAGSYPFEGLRVLDFGVGAVGVEVGRLFAEYGADVIKVESNAAPDFIRIVIPGGINAAFASSSRSKRSLGVNLKTKAGLDLLFELVRISDILSENNGAGVMDRLGLGYDVLREINPRLIMFSSHLLGSSGPWKDWVGYGPNAHPVSGLQYLWNYPEDARAPAGSTNIYPDHVVGRVGAAGVVAALIERERTGRGRHVEAAQFESAIGFLGDLMLRESLAPGSVAPQGNASPRGAPWGAYPCAGEDQWCVINVRSDDEWRALAHVVAEPWTGEPAYATALGRTAARERIDAALAAWTVARPNREVMDRLQQARVPAVIMSTPADHYEDPHLSARGYHRPIDQTGVGEIVLEGPAFHGSDLPEPIVRPAPLLGEHTREVCRELLDLSDAELDRLTADGVLEPYEPAESA